MATFEIAEGPPGNGKSLYTARKVLMLIARNQRWFKKTKIKRIVCSNMRFSPNFEEKNAGWFRYWDKIDDVCAMKDIDLIWDEVANELDARNWPNLSHETKRFLSRYRKRGVDIYANTQDFSMVDARARLMITRVLNLKKLIGSRDLSTTKPNPRWIWGVILVRQVSNWRETEPEKKKYDWFNTSLFFIEKKFTDIYDTREDIPDGPLAPYKHRTRNCELPQCKELPRHKAVFHE